MSTNIGIYFHQCFLQFLLSTWLSPSHHAQKNTLEIFTGFSKFALLKTEYTPPLWDQLHLKTPLQHKQILYDTFEYYFMPTGLVILVYFIFSQTGDKKYNLKYLTKVENADLA